MLFHLAGTAAAAHADVLQGTAEARLLMALEVGQGHKHIRIHDGASDLGLLHQLTAGHRHIHLVVSLQPVGNDDLTAGGHGVKAVDHGAVHVIQRIFPPAHIQGIAVGKKRLSAPLLNKVRHGFRPVGPQVRQIARLTKMQLDGHKLVIEVDLAHTRRFQQPRQLLLQILTIVGAKIGKKYFRSHNSSVLSPFSDGDRIQSIIFFPFVLYCFYDYFVEECSCVF